ncbi:MAG: hypothetical protein QHC67_01085 [Sphingobium sp.]|uniref:hypothetical protein n=1 Tax=Sphingobium sp. TaxID=1912891 RepID=UPI0029B2CEF8|nr:hypothetical protein [Sphingobium sp.]MDX3908402.1 hypothetical protein [Sphingobium sp.]
MRRTIFYVAAAAGLASGLAAMAQEQAVAPSEPLPLKEFMGHVMQRNAEQLWQWTALLIDEKGEHSGQPNSDEEWENAESDALTLAQLAQALESPTYRIDDKRWASHVAGFRAAAAAGADAAERKDFRALERAGEDINTQCVSCHLTFAPELEAPPPSS